jgi:hypothetical protein
MFETRFVSAGRRTLALLPFDLDAVLADWASLRPRMAREKPAAFTRDEWAYLISFLDRGNLESAFAGAFGEPEAAESAGPVHAVARPGGPVALWLPNNVSLLGALTLVLLSLTGNPLWIKAGSRGDDLTRDFLLYALEKLPAGALRDHMTSSVRAEVFPRGDARNAEWAARAQTRIVFGTDAAAEAVHALPHPVGSVGFSFAHRESEAWIEAAAADDALLETLLRVFAVYGQAACTSPSRVVLLDGSEGEARALRDRLLALWPRLFPADPEMAVASTAVLDHQWAASLGWESRLAARHGAALAAGRDGLAKPSGLRLLPIVPLSAERALATLPERIQTIGHGVTAARERALLPAVAASNATRYVRLSDMHRFGPVWDGQAFWRETFELLEVAS